MPKTQVEPSDVQTTSLSSVKKLDKKQVKGSQVRGKSSSPAKDEVEIPKANGKPKEKSKEK